MNTAPRSSSGGSPRLTVALVGLVLAAPALCVSSAAGQAPWVRPAKDRGGTMILDTRSYWRVHVTLRPTVFGTQNDARPRFTGKGEGEQFEPARDRRPDRRARQAVLPPDGPRSPLPPPDWVRAGFDDSAWWRDPGPFFGGGAYAWEQRARPHYCRWGSCSQPLSLALLAVRGRFQVTDPGQVRWLRLSLEFRGGAVVYLNGREVVRRYLPGGRIRPETLADDYPKEAYVDPGGRAISRKMLWHARKPKRWEDEDTLERLRRAELRVRRIDDVELPAGLLRRGTNVLALEIHRAALAPFSLTIHPRESRTRWGRSGLWNTLGLIEVRLKGEGDGVVSNARRPEGVQVWNAGPVESVLDVDYGEPAEPLRPVRIPAALDGTFSGQVVVGSSAPLKGLRASVGPFRGETGERSCLRARIRYPRATLWEGGGKYPVHPYLLRTMRFEPLHESPRAEVPIRSLSRREKKNESRVSHKLGAVQPVWLTVTVPEGAAPGLHRAELKIDLEGAETVAVPVEVPVHAFRLPGPADYRTWLDLLQSPANLAAHYEVPLWSEEHWRLIDRSMRFLAAIGNKTLYVPLICRCHQGNSESMVRWVRAAGGGDKYTHDFSILERYLQTASKAGLKPRAVIFQVWDYHIGKNAKWKIGTGMYGQTQENEARRVPVPLLDPATGQTEEIKGPAYGNGHAERFWRPVAEGARRRVNKRGWGEAMILGLAGDYVPKKEAVKLWAKLWPGVPWAAMAHGSTRELYGVPVAYMGTVLHRSFPVDPEVRRYYGWRRERRIVMFDRIKSRRPPQLAFDRGAAELALVSNMRGIGRLSLDNFRWRKRYPGTSWGSISLPWPILAPGPDGPIATCRFEMLREGAQDAEARIFLERALTDERLRAKLGAELVAECQRVLDERTRHLIWADEANTNTRNHSTLPLGPLGFDWYAGWNWEGRLSRLYAAAAKAAAIIGQPGEGPRAIGVSE
ncbi:MAG: glycoside hydrolase domain-containing protein [Planctomycetota bacterium]